MPKNEDNVTQAPEVSQEATTLAVKEEQAREFYGDKSLSFFTSLPMHKKATLARAMGDADYNLRDFFKQNPGAVIEIVHIVNHMVEIVGDDNEITPGKRTVLIDKDGKTYASVAEGIISSLGNLFKIYGLPPWDNLKITAREVKTRRGFYTLNIIPVDTDEPEPVEAE